MSNILEVNNLRTSFFTKKGEVQAVRNVSFKVGRKEIVGFIGEMAIGKSINFKIYNGFNKSPRQNSGRRNIYF